MANCFWQRCTCPTGMPCQEHQGIWCSRFRGVVITDLSQVQNELVAEAFAVIRSLTSRAGDDDSAAAATEALQRDWERRRADLEQRYPNPDQVDQQMLRDELMALAREADATARNLEREFERTRTLLRDPEREIRFLTPNLLIPFHDADGYCDCYNHKLAKLSAAAGQLSTAELALVQATRDLDSQRRDAAQATFGFMAGMVFIPALAAFAVAGATLLLALLLLFALLIALIIQMSRVLLRRAAFHRAKAALLQARLLYYRLQHISTCERPVPGWQRVQPPSTEDRTEEQREVDQHLEEQIRESGTGQ